MTQAAIFRNATFLLLLIFPAQLLALAYLPCLHAASTAAGHLPPCHLMVAPDVEQGLSPDSASGPDATAAQDCSKCQMQAAFSAMYEGDSASVRAEPPAIVELRGTPRHFYDLYPDPLKRPPRRSA